MKIYICAEIDDINKKKIIDSDPDDHFIIRKKLTQDDVDQADVIIGNPDLSLNLNSPHLKALLLNSAGNDRFIKPGVLNKNTLLTNASGSYGPAIAEHVLGMIIALNKNFSHYFESRQHHRWQPRYDGRELYHSTVLIIGLGDIGYHFAKRVKAFDTHVIGIRHRSQPTDYVDEIYTPEAYKEVIPRADYILLALPETKETIHLFDDAMFDLMKPGSVIANVGRGSAIDNEALMAHLDSGQLYGACLDVVDGEPLASNHPLWNYDNVLITPHVSGGYHWHSVQTFYTELCIRNLKHLKANEPLENQVDTQLGYRQTIIYRK